MLWRRNATAKVVTSITASDWTRAGGDDQLDQHGQREHDGEAEEDSCPDGPVTLDENARA